MTRVAGAGLAILSALTLSGVGPASQGSLDPSFGSDGRTFFTMGRSGTTATASVPQPDGKIVIAGFGVFGSQGAFNTDFVAARLHADGSLDTSFGTGGTLRTSIDLVTRGVDRAWSAALGPGGTIVLAGNVEDPAGHRKWAFVRYTSSGALDPNFSGDGIQILDDLAGSDTWASYAARAVAVQNDGKIVAAGSEYPNWVVARLNADGTLDDTFGVGGIVRTPIRACAAAGALQVLTDGRITVAGSAGCGDSSDFAAARYLSDGQLDPTFGTGGFVVTYAPRPENVTDLFVGPDGKLTVLGIDSATEDADTDWRLNRYDSSGALDPSFGGDGMVTTSFVGGPYAEAYSLGVQADGKLVAGGSVAGYTTPDRFALVRYEQDGSLDASFGNGGIGEYDVVAGEDRGRTLVLQQLDAGKSGSRERIVLTGASSSYEWGFFSAIGVHGSGPEPPPPPPQADYTTETHSGQSIVPGTTDVGNHCDDCVTEVALPFPVRVYGTAYRTAWVSSNGNIQFTGAHQGVATGCLPLPIEPFGRSILPYFGDTRTDGAGDGIFVATLGSPPNRRFVVEWRASYWGGSGNANFEVIFSEDSTTLSAIYGHTADSGSQETSGIQASGTGPVTIFSCGQPRLVEGLRVDYVYDGPPPPPPPPPVCIGSAITFPDWGPANPYPSTCEVSGLGSSIGDVDVVLNRLTHSYPDDLDLLLVGPHGQNAIVMSDAGGELDVVDINLSLDDEAVLPLPYNAQLTSESYRPANHPPGDSFPPPAPTPSGNVNLSVFDGTNPNGVWRLYVYDDFTLGAGGIASWGLRITESPPAAAPAPAAATATATTSASATSATATSSASTTSAASGASGTSTSASAASATSASASASAAATPAFRAMPSAEGDWPATTAGSTAHPQGALFGRAGQTGSLTQGRPRDRTAAAAGSS